MRKKDNKKKWVEDKAVSALTIIASEVKFKGTIVKSADILISGHLEGEINSKGTVRICKEGKVEGTICSHYVIIEGQMNGNIESEDLVELRPKARMIGNISTARIAIAEGGFYKGEIRTRRKEDSSDRQSKT